MEKLLSRREVLIAAGGVFLGSAATYVSENLFESSEQKRGASIAANLLNQEIGKAIKGVEGEGQSSFLRPGELDYSHLEKVFLSLKWVDDMNRNKMDLRLKKWRDFNESRRTEYGDACYSRPYSGSEILDLSRGYNIDLGPRAKGWEGTGCYQIPVVIPYRFTRTVENPDPMKFKVQVALSPAEKIGNYNLKIAYFDSPLQEKPHWFPSRLDDI